MRSFAILSASAAMATATSPAPLNDLWAEFKQKYNKHYSKDQELYRFRVFVQNMERAQKMQTADDGSATYGHSSPFADMTEEEFNSRNTLQVTKKVLKEHEIKAAAYKSGRKISLPTSFDWTEKGAVTPVKNQEQCGSCWAFATVANIEGQNFLQNKELKSFAEQELVDCDTNDNGCNGGLPSNAYKDLISNGIGLELESDYDYTAKDGTCAADKSKEVVFLDSWKAISQDEDEIAAALMEYGPLAIGINAGYKKTYTAGISNPWFCKPGALDHSVTIVGFGEENGTKFWKIKNSWGASWGEKGYYRIIRGKGKCGVNRMVTTAIVKKSDESIFV